MRSNQSWLFVFFIFFCYLNKNLEIPVFGVFINNITVNSTMEINFFFFITCFVYFSNIYFIKIKSTHIVAYVLIFYLFVYYTPLDCNFFKMNHVLLNNAQYQCPKLLTVFFDFSGPGLLHGISFLLVSSLVFSLNIVNTSKLLSKNLTIYKQNIMLSFNVFIYLISSLYVLFSGAYWAYFSEIWTNWYNNDLIEVFYICFFFLCIFSLHNTDKPYLLFRVFILFLGGFFFFLTLLRLGLLTSKHTSMSITGLFVVFSKFTPIYVFMLSVLFLYSLRSFCINLLFYFKNPNKLLKMPININFFFISNLWVVLLLSLSLLVSLLSLCFLSFIPFFVIIFNYFALLVVFFWFSIKKTKTNLKGAEDLIHWFFISIVLYFFYLVWNSLTIITVHNSLKNTKIPCLSLVKLNYFLNGASAYPQLLETVKLQHVGSNLDLWFLKNYKAFSNYNYFNMVTKYACQPTTLKIDVLLFKRQSLLWLCADNCSSSVLSSKDSLSFLKKLYVSVEFDFFFYMFFIFCVIIMFCC